MKQISMQEAMRAVANGQVVHYESVSGSKGIISFENSIVQYTFLVSTHYFIKETVKVALFCAKNDDRYLECYTELEAQGSGVKEFFERVSDWVEIEVKK